jgi:hypothetical protein|tara:strand:- start:102 stop:245 length:144 start_codon:yes stop_codon:yes gene_type:complete
MVTFVILIVALIHMGFGALLLKIYQDRHIWDSIESDIDNYVSSQDWK